MKNTLLLLFVFLLSHNPLYAQNTGENKLGSWYELTSSNKISDKFSVSGSFTNWNYELPANRGHLRLGILGLNYHFNPKLSIGLSYAYGDIDSSFEINDIPHTKENRIIEQLIFNHKLNTISFSQRLRLEQRFLEYPTENQLTHRIRYRFKTKIPLNNTLFISTYDEIHFNLNKFDFQQNRAFMGLGILITKNINTEIGYARHSFKTKSFNRLSLQLNLKCDFRQKKS
ncbi:hypothetical protein ADIWIN_1484 [Winogradskyella psychrotolerans RS-3]|uniref:DUF2490 domain-containing protein n=1 Tax=Winogradskyella psychrotolerans RS-3 TaxID=641526 RepID=S7X345_9FLAO|nr:DUF2490 domain-containing protein [Winogradskyella psychrotolerans]EPR73454.1 hypothetical protein ADIWIN_1484 [Winogradskyella psychrotolerans RS-3]